MKILSRCGMLLALILAVIGTWVGGRESPLRDAWVLDETERIITDLVPGETKSTSFRLRNMAPQPRRILGAWTC